MRRFSKIFSGIAAILLGVGIILIAFGIGRAKSDWEKYRENGQGNDRVRQEYDGVSDIRMDVPFGYVHIGTSVDKKVHFEAENVTGEKLLLRQTGGELDICMDSGKNTVSSLSFLALGWGFDRETFAVQEYRLLLPEDYGGSLDIELGCGKLYMEGVEAGEMDISVNAGELVLNLCRAERLDASCDIGNCLVEGSFRNIRVNGNIGEIGVNVYGRKDDYNGVIRCDIGEIGYYSYDGRDVLLEEYAGDPYDQWKWNQSGGLGIRERWEGRNAKGSLEVTCDIGMVNVTFRGSIQEAVAEVSGTSGQPQIPGEPLSDGSAQEAVAGTLDEPEISGWETEDDNIGAVAD